MVEPEVVDTLRNKPKGKICAAKMKAPLKMKFNKFNRQESVQVLGRFQALKQDKPDVL